MSFPFVRQYDAMDCGPACLSMVAAWYGKRVSLETIRRKSYLTREGVSFLGLKEAAESINLKAIGVKIPYMRFSEQAPLPCIVHWEQNHFIIVYRINKKKVWIADPAIGLIKLTEQEFLKGWCQDQSDGEHSGMALLLEPSDDFEKIQDDTVPKSAFSLVISYLKPYKRTLIFLLSGLLAGSIIQLVFPFLTQAIIDRGIKNKDIHFIYLLLFGQLSLVAGRLLIDFSRGWLLLHLGTNINISIVSEFLRKLMKLPIAYFDTKMNGDILQRIDDNNRIEAYLTSSSLAILFSLFNIIVFAIVLAFYSIPVLSVFLFGTALYFLYIFLFMSSREKLDNIRFRQMSSISGKMINIVDGMQEMKIAGNEEANRKEWEGLQMDLLTTRMKGLKLSQFQSAGGTLIHETVNVVITIISATSVINGTMTLGMMLAVQFITGQLNGPVSQMINFILATQDAKISLERLAEVQRMDNEDINDDKKAQTLPDDLSISVRNVSFQYEGPGSPMVLDKINLFIPQGKITAIVGESGSGKTTLLKLLMGFYRPVNGSILIGEMSIENISIATLRKTTGVVMQEGYIFPDTIMGNIAPGIESPDKKLLKDAIDIANLDGLINSLPLGLKTKVGPGGHGLSQGQKQRILIARVVYKQPSVLILDEATSSLDATNEKMIVENLSAFFQGRTVIVVAHRLSTVRNAHNIIVLEGGRISESGSHTELVRRNGSYFRLIKNQLELGN
jgi:ATP-binding cassette, subfamily B, bacterial